MSIVFPLSLPDGIEFTDLNFKPIEAVGESQSPFTLETRLQRHQGQLWMVEAMLGPMHEDLARAMIAFKMKLKGKFGTFLFGDVTGAVPRGVATGFPIANTLPDSDSDGVLDTNREREEVLYTRGWTPNVPDILKEGDYIQLGSGATARLYINLNDVASDADGEAVLDIWPRLRADIADGSALIVQNTVGLFRMSSNIMDWTVTGAMTFGLQFTAQEDG